MMQAQHTTATAAELNPSAALDRARSLKIAGRLAEAADAARQALGRFPYDLGLRVLLIETLLRQERLPAAAAEIEALARITQEALTPLKPCAADLYAAQCREAARLALRAYLGLCPEDPEALALLTRITCAQREPPAPQAPRRGQPAPPAAEFAADLATATLAEIYFAQGQLAEATAVYLAVAKRHPTDERARRRLAELQRLADATRGDAVVVLPAPPLADKRLLRILEQWQQRLRERLRAPQRLLPQDMKS